MLVLLRTQSDERLVALARSGHDRAFEAIVERYRRPLLRACRRILPEARAEDALQQALTAAWAGLRRGDDVVELRPWLFRIVRNTALNQLRVSGYDVDELVETLTAADDPEDEVVRRAVVRQTLAAVAALPERQREALLRTAIEGRAQADVARDLGLSREAMRQLVHRARVAVRAAATAVVPMPVATWLASAGGATTATTLAKAGTLAILAGGAVTAPTLIDHRPPAPRDRADASADIKGKPHRTARDPQAAAPATVETARIAATESDPTPPRPLAPTTTPEPVVRRRTISVVRRDDHGRDERERGGDHGEPDDRDEPVTRPDDDRDAAGGQDDAPMVKPPEEHADDDHGGDSEGDHGSSAAAAPDELVRDASGESSGGADESDAD